MYLPMDWDWIANPPMNWIGRWICQWIGLGGGSASGLDWAVDLPNGLAVDLPADWDILLAVLNQEP